MYRFTALLLMLLGLPVAHATLLVDDRFEDFRATGLSPGGGGGTLDSDHYSVLGASDGDTDFGVTREGGDFGRGVSAGGVRSGGLHAFLVADGTPALGVQATSGDFTPGAILRRVVNASTRAVQALRVALDLWYLNDGPRSTRIQVEFALDPGNGWDALAGASFDTPAAADTLGWQHWPLLVPLPLAELAPAQELLLRWRFDDVAGTGARDEIALSALRVWGTEAVPGGDAVPLRAPASLPLAVLAAGVLLAARGASARTTA